MLKRKEIFKLDSACYNKTVDFQIGRALKYQRDLQDLLREYRDEQLQQARLLLSAYRLA